MRIRWTEEAATRLEEIKDYVASDDPKAASKQVRLIVASIRTLSAFPNSGRPGRVENTRELVVPATPYVVAYRVVRTPSRY